MWLGKSLHKSNQKEKNMFRGFYTLTSSMVTNERRLNVISNNMANASTPGFKRDNLITTTFQEALAYRTGNRGQVTPPVFLGNSVHKMRVLDERVTYFGQGVPEFTARPLDVAIMGDGFFEIETFDGETVFTRNGSFTIDHERYLVLQHVGRVIGYDGEWINLETDRIEFRSDGTIVMEAGSPGAGTELGRLGIVGFADNDLLEITGEGLFLNLDEENMVEVPNPNILWRHIERSNVSAIDEMVAMMASQRNLQAAAQIIRTYDQLMQRAANDIARF